MSVILNTANYDNNMEDEEEGKKKKKKKEKEERKEKKIYKYILKNGDSLMYQRKVQNNAQQIFSLHKVFLVDSCSYLWIRYYFEDITSSTAWYNLFTDVCKRSLRYDFRLKVEFQNIEG